MAKQHLKDGFSIELRSIDSIRPDEKNPRKNDAAVDAAAGLCGWILDSTGGGLRLPQLASETAR